MGKIVGRFQQARLNYQSRLGRPVSLEEVARYAGISRQAMSDIENGRAIPRPNTLAKLCELYGVQPGDLLVYEEEWLALHLAVA
jgi:transcriptional regulator with XRE-family HTH domain